MVDADPIVRLNSALEGRYRIERKLGAGGMATVYLADDVRHERMVALKVLKPELSEAVAADRFLAEIKTTANLQHPNILPLHDSGEEDGLLYYVMPYVEGESLKERLARQGPLPVDDTIKIARDLAAALDYAHRKGVIHRDIKPANILMADGRPIISDFGIALGLSTADNTRVTASGVTLGTALYMSPEQAGAEPTIDGKSDQYSLACVIFEMLSGEAPFQGSSTQSIIAKHLHAPVPDIRAVRPDVRAETYTAIARALAKNPSARFSTVLQFAEALSNADRPRSRLRLLVGAVTILSAAGLATVLFTKGLSFGADTHDDVASVADDPARLAVIYFEDATSDSSLAHIARGLTEALIFELSGVEALHVISKGGVRPFLGTDASPDSVASVLDVQTVVDGRVQESGESIRVTVELIDATSNTYVDRFTVERPRSDFAGLERAVAQDIAAALRRRLGREVSLRRVVAGTSNPEARELVLRARSSIAAAELISTGSHEADIEAALDALTRADSLLVLAREGDPGWIRPVLDLGWSARERGKLRAGAERLRLYEQGLAYAEEALAMDPSLAEALALRGTLSWDVAVELQSTIQDTVRLRLAEADLRASLAADPSVAAAWATLSFLLLTKGSFAEANLAARRAFEEDAYLADADAVYRELFFGALLVGQFEEAGEWCARGRQDFPGDWRFVECQLTLMRHNTAADPDPARAWSLAEEWERLDPDEVARASGREYFPIYRRLVAATISARAGSPEIARAELSRALEQVRGNSSLRWDLAYDEAYLRLVLGEAERAALLLDSLVSIRPVLSTRLARDPLFKELRDPSNSPRE